MSKRLLSKMEIMYPSLSKGHKRIADFIRQQYDKAAFMTAASLGVEVNVSESTVVRFAKELGYAGYPDLQRQLRELVKSQLTSVQRMEVANTRIGEDDVLDMALLSDIEMIRLTREQTSRASFYNAVDAINAAKQIYILGVRSSAALASFAAYYLNTVYDNIRLLNSSTTSELFEQLYRIDENDVCIAISFPRYSKQTIRAAKYAMDQGASVVAITDSDESPLAPFAKHMLLARSNMVSFVDSLTAPLSLINALIAALARKQQDTVYQNLHLLESIWDEYEVYQNNTEEDS